MLNFHHRLVKKKKKMSKICSNCFQLSNCFLALVDLNLYNGRGGRLKFKRCKKNKYCLTLILDKISINMKNLNDNLVKN